MILIFICFLQSSFRLFALTLLILCPSLCLGSQDVDYLAQNLQVQYSVLTNMESSDDGAPRTRGTIQLTNIGGYNISAMDWELYLCSIRMWEPDVLRENQDAAAPLGNTGLLVEHVSGCLHRIVPGNAFQGFIADMTLLVPFVTSDWQAAKTDISPNWYITAPKAVPTVLFYTAGETLSFSDDFTVP